jgi:hypothetical protein
MFYSAPSGGGHPPQQQLPPRSPPQELPCPQATPPPPTRNPNKGKGKDKGKGKGKNNGSDGSDNNSRVRHDVTLLLQSMDRHHLDVARDASSTAAADASIAARPTCCTDVLRGSRRPLLHSLIAFASSTSLYMG